MIRKPRMKWLLVEWECRSGIFPEYDLVHVRSLVDSKSELHTGKTVCVNNGNHESKRAKVVMVSDDKRFLDQQLIAIKEHSQQIEQAAAACNEAYRKPSYEYNTDPTRNQIKTIAKDWSSDEDDEIDNEIRAVYASKRKMHQKSKHDRNKITTMIRFESDPPLDRDINQQSSLSKMTYDQGTQTIEQHPLDNERMMTPDNDYKIKALESALEEMEDRMSFLTSIIQKWTELPAPNNNMQFAHEDDTHYHEVAIANESLNESQNFNSTTHTRNKRTLKEDNNYHSDVSPDDDTHGNGGDDMDMVPIGSGKTLIPKHIVAQIDWNSYTMATRKLLMAVFPRRTLATHSLTGKSSPAFMNKPAKLCLDPIKINDIVDTVKSNCNVKENLVRNAITTKCADENKMYRMRLEKIGKRQKPSGENQNQENIPPAPDTSSQQPA